MPLIGKSGWTPSFFSMYSTSAAGMLVKCVVVLRGERGYQAAFSRVGGVQIRLFDVPPACCGRPPKSVRSTPPAPPMARQPARPRGCNQEQDNSWQAGCSPSCGTTGGHSASRTLATRRPSQPIAHTSHSLFETGEGAAHPKQLGMNHVAKKLNECTPHHETVP